MIRTRNPSTRRYTQLEEEKKNGTFFRDNRFLGHTRLFRDRFAASPRFCLVFRDCSSPSLPFMLFTLIVQFFSHSPSLFLIFLSLLYFVFIRFKSSFCFGFAFVGRNALLHVSSAVIFCFVVSVSFAFVRFLVSLCLLCLCWTGLNRLNCHFQLMLMYWDECLFARYGRNLSARRRERKEK